MARTGNFLRVLFIGILIGIVSCKSKKKPAVDTQKLQGPPLPPLLPPVPPIQQIEYLTRQQLAFIRHHQQLQKSDKGIYNPYACLPKYICIVEDEAGDKRTTIVSSLHPALRDIDKQDESSNPGPSIGKIHVPQLAVLGHYDPEGLYRDRIVDDAFLKDQEEREKFALALSLSAGKRPFEAKLPSGSGNKNKKGGSIEDETSSDDNNSEESNEDTNDDDNGDDEESQEGDEPSSSSVNESRRRQPPGFPPRSFDEQSDMINSDTSGDHIATVPWDDSPSRTKNGQVPSAVPSGSGGSGFGGGFLRRMLFRSKRDVTKQPKNPFMTRLGPGIKSSDQCRILYNGCELKYDEIMRIASAGQVLIEKDDTVTVIKNKPNPPPTKLSPPEDDEVEQAQREASLKFKNKMKPGGFTATKIKYPSAGPNNANKRPVGNPNSPYNKHIKMKPKPFRPAEDEVDGLPIASLPVLPMKFHFGKPMVPVKKPGGQNDHNNGYQPQEITFGETPNFRPTTPQRPMTTTPTPPIFVKNPVYKKVNRTATVTNVVQVNSTHALKIVKPTNKPYRPAKTPVTDNNGRPVSFASVFTEIAGSSGGIHDFFDKVALAVGGPPANNKRAQQKKAQTESESSSPSSQSISRRGGEVSSEEEEEDDQEDDPEEEDENNNNDDQEDSTEDEEGDDVESSQDDLVDEGPVKKEDATASGATTDKKVFKYKVSNKKKETTVSSNKNNKESSGNKNNKNQEDDENDEEEVADDEGQEEELNDDATVEVDLPEFLPDHIKQGIIEDIKNPGKRQKEAEAAGKKAQAAKKGAKGGDADEAEEDDDGSVEQQRPGGPGGPGGRPMMPHGGRPGGLPGRPSAPGGFIGGQRPGPGQMRPRPSFFRNGQMPNSRPQGPPGPTALPLPKPYSITIF